MILSGGDGGGVGVGGRCTRQGGMCVGDLVRTAQILARTGTTRNTGEGFWFSTGETIPTFGSDAKCGLATTTPMGCWPDHQMGRLPGTWVGGGVRGWHWGWIWGRWCQGRGRALLRVHSDPPCAHFGDFHHHASHCSAEVGGRPAGDGIFRHPSRRCTHLDTYLGVMGSVVLAVLDKSMGGVLGSWRQHNACLAPYVTEGQGTLVLRAG